ncbi:hypothetical protein GOP47_0021658 [Adiantum capillus-veneris]|uniref:glucan endo-1,3-beta-D-glucosidase n=1 Tax=Adiantum capillus-veneris TaxID=13818 RepID=A0A9D4U7V3_ADICA|nr:hypothetical protein GOP47_0021658 [Adiantum capillus-veneris]
MLSPKMANASRFGLCYGRVADNLPSPQMVAQLLVKDSVTKVRIYDYNVSVIQAFAGTNIELIVTIPNEELSNFQSEAPADQWVNNILVPLLQSVKITVVTVGVEVPTLHPNSASLVLPAMQNIHTGLTKANLADQIRVSTAHSMAILKSSFPPSSGAFNDSLATSFVGPILDFLKATGSFYMVNAYPFHAYMSEMDSVALDYALFQPKDVVVDLNTNLSYSGLLLAQVDAVYFAMEAMGHSELSIMVSETGWPRAGDSDEAVANVQNAATYNNNLLMLVENNTGTPHRTGHPLDVYIFSIFDEDMKTGKSSERHWGVFDTSENTFYYLDLNASDEGSQQKLNGTGSTWCVALPSASNASLEAGLNFACGKGNADCEPIQQGGACFLPNTYVNHASYAYNSYYQNSGDNTAACDFGGTATITTEDPSYGSCIFKADSVPSIVGGCCGNGTSSSWRKTPGNNMGRWLFLLSCILCLL